MAKRLRDLFGGKKTEKTEKLSLGKEPGVDYSPRAPDDRKFVAKHAVTKSDYADRGNDPLDGVERKPNRETNRGYDQDEAERVYGIQGEETKGAKEYKKRLVDDKHKQTTGVTEETLDEASPFKKMFDHRHRQITRAQANRHNDQEEVKAKSTNAQADAQAKAEREAPKTVWHGGTKSVEVKKPVVPGIMKHLRKAADDIDTHRVKNDVFVPATHNMMGQVTQKKVGKNAEDDDKFDATQRQYIDAHSRGEIDHTHVRRALSGAKVDHADHIKKALGQASSLPAINKTEPGRHSVSGSKLGPGKAYTAEETDWVSSYRDAFPRVSVRRVTESTERALEMAKELEPSHIDKNRAELRAIANKAVHVLMMGSDHLHGSYEFGDKVSQARRAMNDVHDHMCFSKNEKTHRQMEDEQATSAEESPPMATASAFNQNPNFGNSM